MLHNRGCFRFVLISPIGADSILFGRQGQRREEAGFFQVSSSFKMSPLYIRLIHNYFIIKGD